MWRAETKNNLEKYAIFIFTGGSPTNPWDMTNPRSNFRSGNGTLTPFGRAYAAWDGDTAVRDNQSYIIHNRSARHRLKNDGSSTLTQDTIRVEDASTQWYLEDAGNGNKYVTSLLDGKRLNLGLDGRLLNYAPAGTTGPDVEWRIQQDQYGWHNIVHASSGKYLQLNRVNNASNAPTSLTWEAVSAAEASGNSTDWWFVRPWNEVAAPNTSGPGVATATFNANTDHTIDVVFSGPIDTDSLQTSDFVFENQDLGFSLGGSDLFLLNVTDTSATIRFRELPLIDGNWQMTVAPESFVDSTGAGNPLFQMDFTVLHGDADFDNDVDGSDFLAWQRGFGTLSPDGTADQGDANHDLSVNGADLFVWQNSYGSTTQAAFAAAVAPTEDVAVETNVATEDVADAAIALLTAVPDTIASDQDAYLDGELVDAIAENSDYGNYSVRRSDDDYDSEVSQALSELAEEDEDDTDYEQITADI